MLQWAGLEVQTFASGDDFLAARPWPDCVVHDLHMPDMSGFDVQARLTAAGVPVPVIAITGHDTPENRQRALAGGAAQYLLKPVDGQVLVDAINSAVAETAASAGERRNIRESPTP